MQLLGACSHHVHPEAQHSIDFIEPDGAPLHGFDQRDMQVRPRNGDKNPGKTGPGADVGHRSDVGVDRINQEGAIEQVPLPQAVHLSRPDQTALGAIGRQHPRVLFS